MTSGGIGKKDDSAKDKADRYLEAWRWVAHRSAALYKGVKIFTK
jgi:hypothetical protein